MPVPQDLNQYLKEIQDYFKLQQEELKKEWKAKEGKLPPSDKFSKLTQAISCVESLKSMQKEIKNYWKELI